MNLHTPEYAIGAILLDLDQPERLISALAEPLLLVADASERDGYVPNVVYSCGSLLHNGTIVMPMAAAIPRCGSPPLTWPLCWPS